jgi:hypothetical protein
MGYARRLGVIHRRTVRFQGDSWRIDDELLGRGSHEIAIRWRLAPGEWANCEGAWNATLANRQLATIRVDAPSLAQAVATGELAPRPAGWESLYYGEKTPCPSLVAAGVVVLPYKITTEVTFQDAALPTGSSKHD